MHIDSSTTKGKKGQVYIRHLLRESYRENGKVQKRTIANISHCSAEEISTLKLALRHKHNLNELGTLTDDVEIQQGTSFGATYALKKIADRLGITGALGNSQQGKMALWQVLARTMAQGSRLSAVRLAGHHSAAEIIGLDSFTEDHLYANLDWLCEHQIDIEDGLYQTNQKEKSEFFLYDITSSYLEGTQNELGNWGYNRDKKNGKMQIVVGLLCNTQGLPVSIEVFDGATSDCSTVKKQMDKIANRWNVPSITLIGDKGMIQGPQIDDIVNAGHSFITTIRKSRIEALVVGAGYQTTLIDEDLLEIIDGGYRYILRRNPSQAIISKDKREELIHVVKNYVASKNKYLSEHKKASLETSLRDIDQKISKFKLNEILTVITDHSERSISITINEDALNNAAQLDGCYAMKTNIFDDRMSCKDIHDKYKELALVEDAFRCSKTELLEMRPIHVRKAKRTRGHVFVVMLGYLIIKELERCWKEIDLTVDEGIDILKSFQTIDLSVRENSVVRKIPTPNKITKQLFELLDIQIPELLPSAQANVATRKKVGKDRK